MRDIPGAIAEGLRVLKPGGVMITTCDSFRPDNSSWERELVVFDRDEAVLLGVNEQIPPLGAFLETPLAHRSLVTTELFTHVLYGGRSGRDPDLHDLVRWDVATDLPWLRKRSGALALRLTLNAPRRHPRRLQTLGVLRPSLFASWLGDQTTALSNLTAILPSRYVDAPFPGRGTKFELFNGWRRPRWFSWSREGYKRARWFMRRDARSLVTFEVDPGQTADFTVLINGRERLKTRYESGWQRLAVPLDDMPVGAVYALEIRRDTPASNFDEGCFRVRRRSLSHAKAFSGAI